MGESILISHPLFQADLSTDKEALANQHAPTRAFSHAENLKRKQTERQSVQKKVGVWCNNFFSSISPMGVDE